MHILVVLLHETLIHPLAEFANLILVDLIGVLTSALLRDLDEFVAHVQLLLLLLTATGLWLLRGFCLDWSLVEILRLLYSTSFV